MTYSSADLDRIAEAIGPCLPDRGQGEMLEHIERAAQDYQTERSSAAAARKQLRALAEAVAEANRRLEALDLHADICLVWAAREGGLELRHDYLTELAAVADRAATMPDVRTGPQKNAALDDFLRAIADIVEHFAGWRRKVTYSDYDECYSGRFLGLAKACREPLAVEQMSDEALAQVIRRRLQINL
jgi:hypothetical protein